MRSTHLPHAASVVLHAWTLLVISTGGSTTLRAGAQATAAASISVADTVKRVAPGVVLIRTLDQSGRLLSLGSGFVASDGRVITNAHVLAGASSAEIIGQQGQLLIAVQFAEAISVRLDIAVLSQVAVEATAHLQLTTRQTDIGEHVVAFGAPQGLANTVSDGILSAVRQLDDRSLLQITAPISPGSSGGPVTDISGQVVGIATAFLAEGQNLNFAVRAEDIRALLTSPPGHYNFPAPTPKDAAPTDLSESVSSSGLGPPLSDVILAQPLSRTDILNFFVEYSGCFDDRSKRTMLCVLGLVPKTNDRRIGLVSASVASPQGGSSSAIGFWLEKPTDYREFYKDGALAWPILVQSRARIFVQFPWAWREGASVSLTMRLAGQMNTKNQWRILKDVTLSIAPVIEFDGAAESLTRSILGYPRAVDPITASPEPILGPIAPGQEKSHALVYVYRAVKYKGRAVDPSVQVDNVELVRMDNNRFFSFWLAPGYHSMNAGGAAGCQIGETFEISQTYFFRVDIDLAKCFKLTPVDSGVAKRSLAGLKPLNPKNVRNGAVQLQ